MSKGNKRSWYKRWWGKLIIVFSFIFLSLTFALAFAVFNTIDKIEKSPNDPVLYELNEEQKELIEGKNRYWLGSAQPKITIVEFGDYACPLCKASFPKIRELGQKYKHKVKYIFRDYPVVTEESLDLAMAANCAGEQGLFWVMHDKLFINQGIKGKAEIKSLALQIGMDKEKFSICYDEQKHLARIKKDSADAERLGVSGTPTFFINGQKITGNLPYELLENIILNIN